jgi:hypothetical protein
MNVPDRFDLPPLFGAFEKLRSERIAEETAAGKKRPMPRPTAARPRPASLGT